MNELVESPYACVSTDILHSVEFDRHEAMIALKEAMQEKMNEYQKFPYGFRKAHFAELAKYREIWKTTFSSRICLACLVKECMVFLPCQHGLCERCFRTCAGEKRSDIAVQLGINSCPLCCQTWQKRFGAWFSPRNSYRIMSLDGGGIKGVVAVMSMRRLLEETGLSIPFHAYFDLIVGTSIGGILAMLIGLKKLSLGECERIITNVAKTVLRGPQKESQHLFQKVWLTAKNLVKVITSGAIYSSDCFNAAVGQALGLDTVMFDGSNIEFWDCTSYPIRVAVTTVESTTSQCRIFTNYNSGNHPKNRFYRPALEEDPSIQVPIMACDA